DGHFRAGLAGAIRIVSTKRVGFPIPPLPANISITLVASNGHNSSYRLRFAGGFQHVNGAHHIHIECVSSFLVREPDKRLSCQMEDNFRPVILEYFPQATEVSDVAINVTNPPLEARSSEIRWLAGWFESITDDISPQII